MAEFVFLGAYDGAGHARGSMAPWTERAMGEQEFRAKITLDKVESGDRIRYTYYGR